MAKILENMEIGHNVLHGQWDWMNDPVINSQAWDWDTASTAAAWKHSHNYVHHTYTNIRGKDKDLGYEIMRIDPHQPWHPVYLLQPFYNVLLMMLFEWGVAFHDLDLDAVRSGEKSDEGRPLRAQGHLGQGVAADPQGLHRLAADERRRVGGRRATPWGRRRPAAGSGCAAAGPRARSTRCRRPRRPTTATVAADAAANIIRNVWSYSIIFCGHFPDQTYTFSQEEVEDETKGGRYVRQLVGAANIEGGPFFHVMSGNLGYQVEHHLYPDMPSTRYGEIAPKVREICERYDLPYNTGPLGQQLGMVQRTILRLAFPGGKVRPKPGPYRGEKVRTSGERETALPRRMSRPTPCAAEARHRGLPMSAAPRPLADASPSPTRARRAAAPRSPPSAARRAPRPQAAWPGPLPQPLGLQDLLRRGGEGRQARLPPADVVPGPELEAEVAVDPDGLEADRLVQRDARVVGERDAGDRDLEALAREQRQQRLVEPAPDARAAGAPGRRRP